MMYGYPFLLLTFVSFICALDECTVSSSNDCNLDSMVGNTIVLPGGETRCAYDTNASLLTDATYRFQVQPGQGATRQNIVLYFQSGGGCTNDRLCAYAGINTAFSFNAAPVLPFGIFDDTNAKNPYRYWTRIMVLYCTGDLFVGNGKSTRANAHFNGYKNTQSVLQWMYTNFPTPEKLVISGCSAGSLAAQVYSSSIIQHYEASSSRRIRRSGVVTGVLADSYVGLFSEPARNVLNYYGSCDILAQLGLEARVSDALSSKCRANDLSVVDVFQVQVQAHRSIPFGTILSKNDTVQQQFYCLVDNQRPGCISQKTFYAGVVSILKSMTGFRHNNNVVSYMINDDLHCYLPRPELYNTTVKKTSLVDWIARFAEPKKRIPSICDNQPSWSFTCDRSLSKASFRTTKSWKICEWFRWLGC